MKYKFLILFALTFALLNCNTNNNDNDNEAKGKRTKDFVYIDEGKFKINNKDFYPIMLNYVLGYRDIDSTFAISPIKDYEDVSRFESNTKEEVKSQLNAHFQLIKEMGFNSVRICFDRISKDEDGHYFYYADGNKYYISKNSKNIIAGLRDFVNIVTDKNLKIMLLIKTPMEKELEDFTIELLSTFKDNPTIFAYDFVNEPLYFDSEPNREKIDAYKIVNNWKKIVRQYAPNQLFTIGFSEPIEVFEWDPSILPVDFVQIHTYHPLRVKNEIYWYHKYIDKPWMIGETALPADGDSITYEEQRCFMRESFQWVRDCGGIGYGWWEFQEIPNPYFEANYTGLLNHEGITKTKDGNFEIIGTLKPAVQEISKFAEYEAQNPQRPVNYFNMMGYENICIKGRIIDKQTNEPIEGAVVRGWNKWWSVGMNTFSDENGNFTLYCNDPCVHFEISAPGMTKIKFDKELNFKNLCGKDLNVNDLPNKDLEYHKISYKPFLTNEVCPQYPDTYSYIFNFDQNKFHNKSFEGDLGNLYIEKLEIK